MVDSGSGVAPLPFDLMREAVPADTTKPLDGGLVKPNAAFGAAGAGLVTLDGFSTTAMILAPTSGPITAGTVAANVKLYKRNADATWTEVPAVVKQPPQIVSRAASQSRSASSRPSGSLRCRPRSRRSPRTRSTRSS